MYEGRRISAENGIEGGEQGEKGSLGSTGGSGSGLSVLKRRRLNGVPQVTSSETEGANRVGVVDRVDWTNHYRWSRVYSSRDRGFSCLHQIGGLLKNPGPSVFKVLLSIPLRI